MPFHLFCLLKWLQLWSLETVLVGSCAPLTYHNNVRVFFVLFCFVFSTSLLAGIQRCPRLMLHILSAVLPESPMSHRIPGSFNSRLVIETNIWVIGGLGNGISYLELSTDRKNKYMHLYQSVHIHISITYLYTYVCM